MYHKGKYNDSECIAQCTKFTPVPVDVAKGRNFEKYFSFFKLNSTVP